MCFNLRQLSLKVIAERRTSGNCDEGYALPIGSEVRSDAVPRIIGISEAGSRWHRRRARVSNQICVLGVKKGSLGLAEISKAEFVDQSVAYRPIVTQVPLLVTVEALIAESRHIGASGLESREWFPQIIVIEIVIRAQLLFVVEMVIEAESEL